MYDTYIYRWPENYCLPRIPFTDLRLRAIKNYQSQEANESARRGQELGVRPSDPDLRNYLLLLFQFF